MWDSVFVLCFARRYFVSILVLQSSYIDGKRELVALLFFFLVSRGWCVALPHDATGLSAVCYCGIS